jgi:hypothetical protein
LGRLLHKRGTLVATRMMGPSKGPIRQSKFGPRSLAVTVSVTVTVTVTVET